MTEKSTTSIIPQSDAVNRISLNEKQKEELVELGKLSWSADDIATFFSWPLKDLKRELDDSNSEIHCLLAKGKLMAQFEIESRLYNDAKGGNLTAISEFRRVMRDRSFAHTKLDLFGGAEKEDVFETIQRYYESGEPGNLSNKEQLYLELLHIIHSFDNQYGKRRTIKILTSEPYNIPYSSAADAYANAMEMFNSGQQNTKEAMRNHAADQLDTVYHAILDSAKTAKDYALAGEILDKRNKLLNLNKPDEDEIEIQQYQKQFRLLSLTPEAIGLPAANRDLLAAQIDGLEEVSEQEKQHLLMDAQIIDTDIVDVLEYGTQEKD